MFKLANPRILRERGIMGMNQRNCAYIGRYNDRKLFPNVDDKLKTKTLAMELGPAGIRVNCICPGAVEGDRMERVLANESAATGTPIDDLRAAYVDCTSLKSWVSADDLADMALFLASTAASKISGQILAVDGHTESIN